VAVCSALFMPLRRSRSLVADAVNSHLDSLGGFAMAVRPAIRAPLLKYGICTAVVSAFLAASPLMAQQQSTKEAVDLITNTADKICGLIETSGSTTSAQASVEIKAELGRGLISA
jgi:hypothetical protein